MDLPRIGLRTGAWTFVAGGTCLTFSSIGPCGPTGIGEILLPVGLLAAPVCYVFSIVGIVTSVRDPAPRRAVLNAVIPGTVVAAGLSLLIYNRVAETPSEGVAVVRTWAAGTGILLLPAIATAAALLQGRRAARH